MSSFHLVYSSGDAHWSIYADFGGELVPKDLLFWISEFLTENSELDVFKISLNIDETIDACNIWKEKNLSFNHECPPILNVNKNHCVIGSLNTIHIQKERDTETAKRRLIHRNSSMKDSGISLGSETDIGDVSDFDCDNDHACDTVIEEEKQVDSSKLCDNIGAEHSADCQNMNCEHGAACETHSLPKGKMTHPQHNGTVSSL